MRHLEATLTKVRSYYSRARHAITTSVNSQLTWIKMLISVGFAIIAVAILGVLLGVLVRIHNYRNGTQLQTDLILKDFLISLWNNSVQKTRKNLNSRQNL